MIPQRFENFLPPGPFGQRSFHVTRGKLRFMTELDWLGGSTISALIPPLLSEWNSICREVARKWNWVREGRYRVDLLDLT